MKLAAIDIGTHSVLLLIAQKNPKGFPTVLADEATLTRIGEGLGKAGVFSAGGMERTLAVLKKYKEICGQERVEKIIAVGTAAFRKAENAQAFVRQVEKECRIRVKIICPEREAELTWKAASTDFGKEIAVVDIGGGSTEIILSLSLRGGPKDRRSNPIKSTGLLRFARNDIATTSLPIGSVLLTERYCHSDPISEKDYQRLCEAISEQLCLSDISTYRHTDISTMIATAGTATTLGAIKLKLAIYKHNEVHGTTLSMGDLKKIIADFKSKTIAERKKIPGLEPGRADVILAGSLLLQKIAEHLGFDTITVSDRGVRWGLVYEAMA